MRGFDQELAIFLAQELAKKGVVLSPQRQVKALKKRPDNLLEAQLSDGTTRQVEQTLLATGRVPKTSELGLLAGGSEIGCPGRGFSGSAFLLVCPLNLRRGRLH